MEKKHEKHQNQSDETPESQPSVSTNDTNHKPAEAVSRPRIVSDTERVVQERRERIQQRKTREVMRTRGLETSMRPTVSSPGSIQHEEKREPRGWTPIVEEVKTVGVVEDRETVKWAAWGALFMSLVTVILLGIYSAQDFEPAVEYHDLELTQKRMRAEVSKLMYNTRLEKIKNAVMHAQFQLLARKDYEAAESILVKAKQDLNVVIDALPVEDKPELWQIRDHIEKVISELRQGPSLLNEDLEKIRVNFSRIGKKVPQE